MIKIWMFVALVAFGTLWYGCTDQETIPGNQGETEYSVVLPDNLHIDSAQVFFFRNLANTDTLILRETIYNLGTTFKRFEFYLPVGYYTVAFWGNVATDRIVERFPYSRDSIWFSYQGGIEPPDIFHGLNYFNVGKDTSELSGMVLLVSRIELTLKKIPDGIYRIEAPISNTSSGVGFNSYLKEDMNPPLTMYLEEPEPDSTYTLTMNCFPSVVTDYKTTIGVYCYNIDNELVYFGKSQPFTVKYGVRMLIACSFDENTVSSKSSELHKSENGNITLEWSYDEKNM